ncbi:MAG: alpha/beta fold hydrolase [Dehalococcoidia bacterium]
MAVIQLNGVGIYFEQNDFSPFWEPPRTPILFIHGLGVDHTIWSGQLAQFGRRRPVVLVDLRGHGRSDKMIDADYSIAAHAEDVLALLRYLSLGPAIVVGTSMGGLIAQQVASLRPDTVRALVLIGTWAEPSPDLNLVDILARFDAAPDLAAYYMPIVQRTHPVDTDPAAVQQILELTTHNPRETTRAGTAATFGYRDPDAARQIKAPTLIVAGEHEERATPERSARLRELIHHARLAIIAGAGHAPYLETPAAFNQAVFDFLEQEGL